MKCGCGIVRCVWFFSKPVNANQVSVSLYDRINVGRVDREGEEKKSDKSHPVIFACILLAEFLKHSNLTKYLPMKFISLLAALSCAVVTTSSRIYNHHVQHVLDLLQSESPLVKSTDGSTEYFFNDAVVDHYGNSLSVQKKWSQRFYFDDSFFGGAGEIVAPSGTRFAQASHHGHNFILTRRSSFAPRTLQVRRSSFILAEKDRKAP